MKEPKPGKHNDATVGSASEERKARLIQAIMRRLQRMSEKEAKACLASFK